jgi:hypothetical protein
MGHLIVQQTLLVPETLPSFAAVNPSWTVHWSHAADCGLQVTAYAVGDSTEKTTPLDQNVVSFVASPDSGSAPLVTHGKSGAGHWYFVVKAGCAWSISVTG